METKKWYQSLTIIAAGIVGILQVIPEIVASVQSALPGVPISTNPIVLKVLSIIGIIVAIYGRITASKPIK